MIFSVGDDEGMQVSVNGKDTLYFVNHDDWCGDTFTGFGASVGIELNREKVKQLYTALGNWLDAQN